MWWISARNCILSRCSGRPARAGIVPEETRLRFLGFGTMNGKDGKPFKTREGGVMRLEVLISEIQEEMYKKITENRTVEEAEARTDRRHRRAVCYQVRRSVQPGFQGLCVRRGPVYLF